MHQKKSVILRFDSSVCLSPSGIGAAVRMAGQDDPLLVIYHGAVADEKISHTRQLALAIDTAYAADQLGEPNSERQLYGALLAQASNVVDYRLRQVDIFVHLAHDITHRAMAALTDFREDSKLSTWFYRVAQNEVNRALKAHRKARDTSHSIDHPDASSPDSDLDDPPVLWEEARRTAQRNQGAQHAKLDVQNLEQGLPPEQARVISLYAQGHSLEEIAEIEKASIGTIRGRYLLAKRKMANRATKISGVE
jgi:RNA polymerase sigma factor (sigma-70 family)